MRFTGSNLANCCGGGGSGFSDDFLIEVSKGNVAGHSLIFKYGRNSDVDRGLDLRWNLHLQQHSFNPIHFQR